MEGLLGGLLPAFNQMGGSTLNILVGRVAWKDSWLARIIRLYTGGIVVGIFLGALVGLVIGVILAALNTKQVSVGGFIVQVLFMMMGMSLMGAMLLPIGVMFLEALRSVIDRNT